MPVRMVRFGVSKAQNKRRVKEWESGRSEKTRRKGSGSGKWGGGRKGGTEHSVGASGKREIRHG